MTTATLPPPTATIHPDALTEVEFGVVVEKDMSAKAIGIAATISQLMGQSCSPETLGSVFHGNDVRPRRRA